ncbi:MAG: tyrosine-type recombinase/integrase [Pyrinomonadaceae bacterium]
MAGQIIKRGETWTVRVFLGRDTNGKRKFNNKTVKGSKKDAQKVLNSMLRDADLGLLGNSLKQTLNEYLDVWLETIAKPRLQYRTFKDYGDLLRRYVRESLGNIKLSDLKAVHIQKLYGEMLERGLSPRIVRYTHATLSSSLKEAVKLDILPRNVATLVQLPKMNPKEMDVLSKDETILFLETLEGERLATVFSFALASGMRCQEYLGLQWKDINFEQGTATVQRAVVWHRTGGGWHFSQPKTAKSRRTIPLPSSVMQELRRHRIKQNEDRLKLGAAWQQNDLVFPSEIGTPLNPPNVTRHFKRILAKAKIRTSIRLYDLRHTTATLLLQAGINPKIVSERLGHSTITLTLDVYSHVLPNMQKDATKRLEQMLYSKNRTN